MEGPETLAVDRWPRNLISAAQMAIRPILTLPDPILRKTGEARRARRRRAAPADGRHAGDHVRRARHRARRAADRHLAPADRHGPGQGGGAEDPGRSWSTPRSSSARTSCGCTRRAACRSPISPPRSSGRPRPASAYIDREGKQQEIELEGIWSTLVQHEIDHLNGVLFIDYLSRLKRDMVVRKFTKQKRTEAL